MLVRRFSGGSIGAGPSATGDSTPALQTLVSERVSLLAVERTGQTSASCAVLDAPENLFPSAPLAEAKLSLELRERPQARTMPSQKNSAARSPMTKTRPRIVKPTMRPMRSLVSTVFSILRTAEVGSVAMTRGGRGSRVFGAGMASTSGRGSPLSLREPYSHCQLGEVVDSKNRFR
jgi:hypothetical protein